MSLLDTASLIVTPNGYKEGKLYSVIPSDGSGDMSVTRATTATRVNSAGLVESMGNNVPRLDYSNGTCPSLLVEPQRTNLFLNSSSFDNAAWTKVQTTTSANVAVSPSGIQDADKLIPNTTSNIHYTFQSISDTIAPWTFSIYAKADGYNRIILNAYNTNFVGFNLTTGTIESTLGTGVTSANIEDAGNGWYRCSITSTSTSSGVAMTMSVFNAAYTNGNANPIFSGNGTDGVLVWGAQFESGSYATSYIPTTSASVTRNADLVTKTSATALIGQTEGTIFVDFYNDGGSIYNPCSISDGYYGEAVYFEQYLGEMYGVIWDGGSQQFVYNAGPLSIGRHRMAIAYKANDIAFYIDGVLKATDTSATIPTCSRIDIGSLASATIYKNYVNAAALWKTRLTNTQLAQLTTI